MALNLRSPIFLGTPILTNGYNEYQIYIYSSTKPTTPEYTIRKNYNANFDAGYIDVSELIRDYLEINFGNDYTSQCVKVTVEYELYDSVGAFVSGGALINGAYGFDSYSYFEDKSFDVDNSPLMISNRQIFALADNLVRIPINTKSNPTVVFLKNGNIVGSQQYTNTAFANNQIKYATIGGTYNFDNYKERVFTDGGVYEETKCLKAFLNEFEISEADEVRIFSDTKPLETIKINTLNECKYEPKKVTFINKFGALQDMYFFKKSVEKMTVTKETYKSNILDSNYSYNRSNHVQRNFNVIGNESVTFSSGYLSEEYNEVFKQLLLSEKVWVTNLTDTEEQVLPINVKTSNITYKTSLNDKLVEYTFEFDKSFDTINNIR
jgi:hypothetical protein